MNDMLGKIVRMIVTVPLAGLGTLVDLLEKLRGTDGPRWSVELGRFLRKEPCWSDGRAMQVARPKSRPLILELISTVKVSATAGKFVAKEKFVRDTGHKAKVKISYLADDFISWFLIGNGKTEDPISEQTLFCHKLRQSSMDGPIIAELGGAEKSETTLSEMFSLMEKQGKGEGEALLNKEGYANIFYIKDSTGVLRAVVVLWCDGGWDVSAFSVEHPRGWDDVDRVFSRNSVL